MPIKTSPLARCKTALAAAVLAIASAPAWAGLFTFEGRTDSGTLAGESFSGSFGFADPIAGFNGEVELDAFELSVFGRRYMLADAESGTTPVAWFDGGAFLGVDYISSVALPVVQLTAGFFDIGDALFAYQGGDPEFVDGFGSVVFTPVANQVPAPATLVLALSGLLLLGGTLVRRARVPPEQGSRALGTPGGGRRTRPAGHATFKPLRAQPAPGHGARHGLLDMRVLRAGLRARPTPCGRPAEVPAAGLVA